MFLLSNIRTFKQLGGIASDSIKLITEFGSPGMIHSLGIIKEITATIEGIAESLEEPEMKKNVEVMNITLEAMRDSRDRMRNVSQQLKDTQIIEEAGIMASSIISRTDQKSVQDLRELITVLKETISSIKRLANEFRSW